MTDIEYTELLIEYINAKKAMKNKETRSRYIRAKIKLDKYMKGKK